MPKSMTLKLKGGAYVDPESGLEHKAHVYKSGSELYSVVLGSVDVQEGRNSYYKLQLLQHDSKSYKLYVFRSWGRVGTTIGGTKLEEFDDLDDAKENFKFLFAEKTGNRWSKRMCVLISTTIARLLTRVRFGRTLQLVFPTFKSPVTQTKTT